jgi:hypothetical protein
LSSEVKVGESDASFESKRLSVEGENASVLEKAVDGGGSENGIRKDGRPLVDVAIGGEEESRGMFSAVEEIEDFLCDIPFHGDDAPIVEYPEMSGEDSFEEVVDRVSSFSGENLRGELLDAGAEDAESCLSGKDADGESEMSFSGAWSPEKESDVSGADEIEGSEFSNGGFVDVGVETPVESFERGDLGELSALDAELERSFPSGIDFAFEKRGEPVEVN